MQDTIINITEIVSTVTIQDKNNSITTVNIPNETVMIIETAQQGLPGRDGAGLIESVNGKVGNVVLDTSDINDTTDKRYVTDKEKENIETIPNLALKSSVPDISNKVDKVTGKQLSTEDYTTVEKNKLAGIENNANYYIHPNDSNTRHVTDSEKINIATIPNLELKTNVDSKIDTAISSLKDGVNTDGDTLAKLRGLISGIQTVISSSDVNLDTIQEIITYIKDNKTILDGVTTNKVNTSDIIDSLTSTNTNKPLSANQGKALKDLLDALTTTVGGKQINISNGTTSQYYRGDKTWQALDKNAIGLGSVDNVSDLLKPISTATQTALNGKENTLTKGNLINGSSKVSVTGGAGAIIGAGVTVDVVESNINIGNLTGTTTSSKISDFVSTVRSTVLTGLDTTINSVISITDTILGALGKLQKQITDNLATLTNHTSNASNPHSTTKAQVGLGNADNTSDLSKPISTATQTALNGKLDSTSYTANDILTKIKTVDGSTSGLDADLLDGQEGSYYLNYNNLSNKPTLPTLLSQLTDDSTHRTVTDTEKTSWSNKADISIATTSVNGLMSSSDKTKLDGVATGANNYVHPANHSPSIIMQDSSNRFVSDAEKTIWNGKQDALGFTAVPNTRTINSKALNTNISLDKTDIGLGNVLNTDTTTTTNITDSLDKRFVTDTQKTAITHTNRTVLDVITNSGDGTKYLANDGTYKTVSGGSGGTVDAYTKSETDIMLAGYLTTDTEDWINGKTLNACTMNNMQINDGYGFLDPFSKKILSFNRVTGSINNLEISNGSTGVAPSIKAVGVDLNVNLNLKTQGTGKVQANGVAVSLEGHTHPNSGGVSLEKAIAMSIALS